MEENIGEISYSDYLEEKTLANGLGRQLLYDCLMLPVINVAKVSYIDTNGVSTSKACIPKLQSEL